MPGQTVSELRLDLDRFAGYRPRGPGGALLGTTFRGISIRDQWKPLEMEPLEEPDLPNLPLGEVTGWHSVPVISEAAAHQLADLLDGSAELLPVMGMPEPYFVLNVLRLVPALVEEESAIFRYPSTGLIGNVSNYSLRAPLVAGIPIFQVE
jgi:hypothetical protein